MMWCAASVLLVAIPRLRSTSLEPNRLLRLLGHGIFPGIDVFRTCICLSGPSQQSSSMIQGIPVP